MKSEQFAREHLLKLWEIYCKHAGIEGSLLDYGVREDEIIQGVRCDSWIPAEGYRVGSMFTPNSRFRIRSDLEGNVLAEFDVNSQQIDDRPEIIAAIKGFDHEAAEYLSSQDSQVPS